jgi:hypothetical protein
MRRKVCVHVADAFTRQLLGEKHGLREHRHRARERPEHRYETDALSLALHLVDFAQDEGLGHGRKAGKQNRHGFRVRLR